MFGSASLPRPQTCPANKVGQQVLEVGQTIRHVIEKRSGQRIGRTNRLSIFSKLEQRDEHLLNSRFERLPSKAPGYAGGYLLSFIKNIEPKLVCHAETA